VVKMKDFDNIKLHCRTMKIRVAVS